MSKKSGDENGPGKDPEHGPELNEWAGLALVGQFGLTVAVPILIGIGAGIFIDNQLRSSPIATLIGLLLGLAAGVYGAYRLVTRL